MHTFNFPCAVLDCSSATSVEDFWDEILVADSRKDQVQVHQSSRSRAESVCIIYESKQKK